MAWLWWMSFCTIETLKTNLQFSLHSAHPKDLIVKGESLQELFQPWEQKQDEDSTKSATIQCLWTKLTNFFLCFLYSNPKSPSPKKPWISGKIPPAFGRRVVACRSSAPKRNCLHQTVGSSDLLAFSTFRFSVSILIKVIKWLQKKTKNNSIYWFVDQLCLDISSLWLIYLISPTISAFSPFTFLHLFMIYNTRNTRTPEISIDEGLESWSPCRARPISHRFCLSQTFSANLFSFTEELSARTACSQQQRRRIKNKISEASSSSLASTRLGDGVWVSIMHESVPYSTYYIKSWNT